jgi:hypothetical protein
VTAVHKDSQLECETMAELDQENDERRTGKRKSQAKDAGDLRGTGGAGNDSGPKGETTRAKPPRTESGDTEKPAADRQTPQSERGSFDPNVNQPPR